MRRNFDENYFVKLLDYDAVMPEDEKPKYAIDV